MTVDEKIKALAAIVILLAVGCAIALFVREHDARVKAESIQAADEKIVAADKDAMAARDAQTSKVAAALTAQAASIQTPQQAAQVVLRYLPASVASPGKVATPAAPIPVVSAAQLPPAVQAQLPAAPSYGILTQQQLVDQAKADLACQTKSDQLTTCAADKEDLQKSLTAETAAAKSWEATAKGGTRLQRFGKVVRYVGCAAGGAIAGSLADKSHPSTGSAIGGAAGVSLCSLF